MIKKRPAVFLDRDGVIVEQVDLPQCESDLKILPGAAQAIATLNEFGYFVVIVGNQPVVARGIITLAEARRLNKVLAGRLAKDGARIDAVYLCPHHPMANLKRYRKVCACRKPAPGMILQAAREHYLDLTKSFMIGDSTQDVQAGNRAKVKMILVRTGHGGKDAWQHEGNPDFVAKNLLQAAKLIQKLSEKYIKIN
jgi:D-glycero-D-manno-heptose 1,7-bisphosphate phosphatase